MFTISILIYIIGFIVTLIWSGRNYFKHNDELTLYDAAIGLLLSIFWPMTIPYIIMSYGDRVVLYRKKKNNV